MEHNIPLITTLAAGFSVALVLGFLAERIKVPALVGYLLAGILILGWPMSRDAYLAQEVTIENIGDELRSVFATLSPPVALPAEPDAGTIVTELAFACMKYGYFRHGLISEDIIRQSSLAVIGYLEQVLPPELAQSRPS